MGRYMYHGRHRRRPMSSLSPVPMVTADTIIIPRLPAFLSWGQARD